ncbi:Tol-Pal system protein TolB [Phycisphaerales bacterium]|nr:Tol-Pal system protein TolB [Phycisphaerales bacterium]
MTNRLTRFHASFLVLAAGISLGGCASSWFASTPPNSTRTTRPGVQVAGGNAAASSPTPTPTTPDTSTTQTETTPTQPATASLTRSIPDEGDVPWQLNVMRVSFAEEGADFDPTVSRDGARLVFASTQHRKSSDLYMKRIDSRVVTQLTTDPADDEMPALSPDGARIAFASNRSGNWDVYVMPIAGGKAVQVTSETSDEIHPSWSPNGKSLVFNRFGEGSGRWEIWIADVANPATPVFIGYGLFPQWCPVTATGDNAGDRILYQLPRERGRRSFSLWTLELNNGVASNQTEITGSAGSAFIRPSWSPDGRWIVFAEVAAPDGSGWSPSTRPANGSLWMISAAGEAKVRLTTGKGLNATPVWGMNNRLFYVSDRSGTDSIWAMDLTPAVQAASAAGGTFATPPAASASATGSNESSNGDSTDNSVVTAGAKEPADPR